MKIETYVLTAQDKLKIKEVIDYAKLRFKSAEDEDFLTESKTIASKLPEDLKRYLYRADHHDHSGVFLVKGFEPDENLPMTPKTWFLEDSYEPKFSSDYLAIIFSAIFGDPFGFETQQKGKLIHDILPIEGREHSQEGANSLQNLNFHTEDTFHPFRADYICLTCLKNPTNVGTLVSGIRDFELPDDIRDVLFESRFYHLSDDTHVEDIDEPVTGPILLGDRQHPYICFDFDFTVASKDDEVAIKAIEKLNEQILKHQFELNLEVGDFCFVDNYKWLHGRKPFQAKYDGTDRWLRRFNIKVDINEASHYRSSPDSRMLSFEPIHKPTPV